jgi:hypothetical protein
MSCACIARRCLANCCAPVAPPCPRAAPVSSYGTSQRRVVGSDCCAASPRETRADACGAAHLARLNGLASVGRVPRGASFVARHVSFCTWVGFQRNNWRNARLAIQIGSLARSGWVLPARESGALFEVDAPFATAGVPTTTTLPANVSKAVDGSCKVAPLALGPPLYCSQKLCTGDSACVQAHTGMADGSPILH